MPPMIPALRFRLLALLALGLAPLGAAETPAIPVRIDPNVELLSLVFRLAGAEEYNPPSARSAYADDAEQWFAPVRDHAAVRFARDVRERRGVSYDAVMSFAVHLTPGLEPKMPFATAAALDRRWTPADAEEFLRLLRAFHRESRFADFLARHADLFARATAVLAQPLAARPYRQWLDDYLGARPADFAVAIGLLNGTSSYGVAVRYPDGREEIRPVLGAGRWDAAGVPVFGEGDAGLIVHEFSHSYTNPLADRFAAELEPIGRRLFEARREIMSVQAYSSPMPVIYETLVRAVTLRYAQLHETPEIAQRTLEGERARGFLWVPGLVEVLRRYEQQRDRYPTLDALMPEIVLYLRATAENLDSLLARIPRATLVAPAPGARDVAPGDGEIRLEFDRPMRTTSRSIRAAPGGFPTKRAEPRFEQDGRVFVYPVTFEPGKTYRFTLNSIYGTGFVSAEGAWPMDPIEVEFTTAAAAAR